MKSNGWRSNGWIAYGALPMRPPACVAFVLLLTACTQGKLHRQGEKQLAITGSVGIPAPSERSFRGTGESDNLGLNATLHYFVLPEISLGGGVGYRYYDQRNGGAHAAEALIVARSFLWQSDTMGVSLDVWFGGSFAEQATPWPFGTKNNYVFRFGPAFEWRFNENTSLVAGYYLSHISNGDGNTAKNPGQNDHQLWVGVSWSW